MTAPTKDVRLCGRGCRTHEECPTPDKCAPTSKGITHSPEFYQELNKRRREFDLASSKLKDAQAALDDAEREYGNVSRSLDALEGCLR
jgi:hypothetical protein